MSAGITGRPGAATDEWGYELPFAVAEEMADAGLGFTSTWAGSGEGWAAEGWAAEDPFVREGVGWEGQVSAGGVTFPSGVVLRTGGGAVGKEQEHWDPVGPNLPLLDTGPAVQGQRLSTNFTVRELVTSGGRAAPVARISPELVTALQRIRDRAGVSVTITSGYRSWFRNRAVYRARGKEPTRSRHCSGQAADIKVRGLTGTQIAKLAIDAAGTELGIGVGRDFAHIDVRGTWTLWNYGGVSNWNAVSREITAYRNARLGRPIVPPSPTPVVPPEPSRVPGTTAAGRLEVPAVALLRSHGGAAPALVMRWNAMSSPDAIDVVVHLHGYSGPAAAMRLPRSIEPISGLDFGDPDGGVGVGRTRPTLMLLPRGKSAPSVKRADRFIFPALVGPGAIHALVREGLALFAGRTGIVAPLGRLILTAHSGGGAPLNEILAHTDPDEVLVYDGLYGSGANLAAWAVRRIGRQVAAPSNPPPALRIVFGSGTAANSRAVAATVCAALAAPGANALAPRFRAEQTAVAHPRIPRRFGWRLLADAGAELPDTRLVPCGAAARGEAFSGFVSAESEEWQREEATEIGEPSRFTAWEGEAFEAEGDAGEAAIGEWQRAAFAREELEEAGETEEYVDEGAGEEFGGEFEDHEADGEFEEFEGEGEFDEFEFEGDEAEGWVAGEWETEEGEETEEAEKEDEAGEADEWAGEDLTPEPEAEAFPSGVVLRPASGATTPNQEHWDPNATGLPLLQTGPAVRKLKITRNFTVGELVTSGGQAADVARISPELVRVLQAIRDRAGKPVRINSGYRSWARNAAVYAARGKKPTLSRHCSGQAADITIGGLTGTQIAKLAIDAGGPDLGIGVGSNYAHVDVRGRWELWTYLTGSADTAARREVTEHRRRRVAAPGPGQPGLAATPDRLAGVVRQSPFAKCASGPQPGAVAMRDQWRRLTGRDAGIFNCRPIRGTEGTTPRPSIHGEGRAIDLTVRPGDPAHAQQMEAYVAWLITNAVELQVPYIIWNRRQWSWRMRDKGWRSYTGKSPHLDHAHVELSWEGAKHPSPLFAGGVPGWAGGVVPSPAPQAPQPPRPATPAGTKLTPSQFVAAFGPHARASEAATGVPALVTLGQAALESGWGAHAPRFNFFGVKARATDPEVTRQLMRTREVHATPNVQYPEVISVTPRPDGRFDYVVRAWFRAYPDAAASFADHGRVLRAPRYAAAFAVQHDPFTFATEVARAGYATDPTYGQTLHAVMRTIERAGWRG